MSRPLPSGMHVILGDSAAGIFRRVFDPGDRLLIDRDVLSCGPTAHCDSVQSWSAMRFDFWTSVVPDAPLHPEATHGLLAEVDRLRAAESITVWAATGLSEQLFIAHVLHRAEQVGVDSTQLRLVQFETRRNGTWPVLGTGELNEQCMSEHPEPAPLSAATLGDYRAAWSALTSPAPAAIERFSESYPTANTWLQRAMRLLLWRFPDRRSGLPRWDLQLLTHARSRGPKAALVIGYTLGDCYDHADLMGDYYLFGRLLRLSDPRLPAPLLEITGDRTSMRGARVTLTAFGADVLEGKASSYPMNPIEDWASGVRLSSAEGSLWFNDDGRLVCLPHAASKI